MKGERFQKANPNLKVNANVVATVDQPQVKIEFIDGTIVRIAFL